MLQGHYIANMYIHRKKIRKIITGIYQYYRTLKV